MQPNKRKRIAIAATTTIAAAILVAAGVTISINSPNNMDGTPSGDLVLTIPELTIMAQVDGEVVTPGVYELPDDARVNDLVLAAGGLTPKGDVSGLDLAAPVTDGQTCYRPWPLPQHQYRYGGGVRLSTRDRPRSCRRHNRRPPSVGRFQFGPGPHDGRWHRSRDP